MLIFYSFHKYHGYHTKYLEAMEIAISPPYAQLGDSTTEQKLITTHQINQITPQTISVEGRGGWCIKSEKI